jgi:hypothetical protein
MSTDLKGTLARDFLLGFFFHGSIPFGAQISRHKEFKFLSCIREVIRIFFKSPLLATAGIQTFLTKIPKLVV